MTERGLSGQALSLICGVSKEAVSNWLCAESVPRPSKLPLLAEARGLTVPDLFVAGLPERSAPVMRYFRPPGQPFAMSGLSDVAEMREHLRQLLPFTGLFWAPRSVSAQREGGSYARDVAAYVRTRFKLAPQEQVRCRHLLRYFAEVGILLVPTPGRHDGEASVQAVSLDWAQEGLAMLVFSVRGRADGFRDWLSLELGLILARNIHDPGLRQDFAHQFSRALLHPDGARQTTSESFWLEHLSHDLFGQENLSVRELVAYSEEVLGTPVFRALAEWQKSEGGRSPSFAASCFGLSLGDAIELTYAVAER